MKTTFKNALFILAIGLSIIGQVFAGPNDFVVSQRDSTDSSTQQRVTAQSGVTAFLTYDPATQRPAFTSIGSGLVVSSGVLALATAPVNADWNATSGLAQVLNKPTIPAAQVNADWAASSGVSRILNKPTIPAAYSFNYGALAARTLAVNTVYQATDTAKAAIIKISPSCSATLSLSGGTTCTMQARVGFSVGLTCASGVVAATWSNGNTGTLTVGLNTVQTIQAPANVELAIGEYFILCPTSGTFTISAAERSVG